MGSKTETCQADGSWSISQPLKSGNQWAKYRKHTKGQKWVKVRQTLAVAPTCLRGTISPIINKSSPVRSAERAAGALHPGHGAVSPLCAPQARPLRRRREQGGRPGRPARAALQRRVHGVPRPATSRVPAPARTLRHRLPGHRAGVPHGEIYYICQMANHIFFWMKAENLIFYENMIIPIL